MVSIKDIAELSGVSVSTVSRVINGKDCVSSDKRAKIMQAVKSTGYVPNRAARDMVLKQTFKVAIIIPEGFNMFQRQLFSDIERHLHQFGYRSSLYFSAVGPVGEAACLRRLKGERLDGVIFLHEIAMPEFHEYLDKNNIPTVFTTFEKEDFEATSIHISESEAAVAAVEHLINLGHRDICLIGSNKYSFGIQRLKGYKDALAKAGIAYDVDKVAFVESYSVQFGLDGMKKLMDRNIHFTALFAITDELALGAIRHLKNMGLSVPDDVSVVGFDDIEISSFTIPSLTTVRQPVTEMGQTSVALLHSLIASKNHMNVNIALPFMFVKRESSAKPRLV